MQEQLLDHTQILFLFQKHRKRHPMVLYRQHFPSARKLIQRKRLDALEEGQAVQDEAINDLGTATSELAEKEGVE